MERRGRGRISRGMLPILALQAISEYSQLDWKPPVTAGLVAANTLVYLRPGFLHDLLPSISDVYFNPHLIVQNRDLKRFILSAFYHLSEPHLVYNMMSLLWKGVQLETMMGSLEFASMVAALLGLSQGITLLLAKFLCFFDYNTPYYYENAAGFSGVLFAMKVILNARSSDSYAYVHGLVVPSRHAAWVELILIQLFVPNVSFLGHLGGILAGILYLRLKGSHPGSDPLSSLVRNLVKFVHWPLRFVRGLLRYRPGRQTSGRTVGGSGQPVRGISGVWRCSTCTYNNLEWFDVCEMCSTQRGHWGSPQARSQIHNSNPSLEELRRRRIERFGR
ncbi:Uncharacterized protein QJS10_CPA16g01804 [Acorus calamus]|uniref:Rhomboid protein Acoca_RBL14 n=1 Tax=Acorus calamus TaxID=4465 RepID=A0A0A7E7Z8_ACOCL|nr:rhomboid protein Acoca_RBL14 [Acorus calamus]KAK1293981.1 Uncharacterized protein QJS10_CPA16g01804 [Acorus calamus]